MTRPPLDPARGAEAARKLKFLGVKGILIKAAELGYIDEVIKPEDTRKKLIAAFKMLENKVAKLPRKKHGNIPL